jgi:probable F420-dependent oxidoreductase
VTAAVRPFRFGLGPAGLDPLRSAATWRDFARRVEGLGYASLCLGEHIDGRPSPGVMAVAIASWTTTLRAAVHMYAADFHHPAMLAREVATIAMLADGRLDVGLGAGWMATDYGRLGITLDRPAVRIERLRETAELVRATWSQEAVSVHGAHVRVDDLTGAPLLGGAPPPRLVMGGGGRRMLTVAARTADVVSINVRLESGQLGRERGATATREATDDKLSVLRAAAGDRFEDLVLQLQLHHVEVTPDRERALERASSELGMDPVEADASPHVLVGSVDQICDRLVALRDDLGVSELCCPAGVADAFAPVVARLRTG